MAQHTLQPCPPQKLAMLLPPGHHLPPDDERAWRAWGEALQALWREHPAFRVASIRWLQHCLSHEREEIMLESYERQADGTWRQVHVPLQTYFDLGEPS